MSGSVYKRCSCRETVTDPDGRTRRRELGAACPKLWRRPGVYASDHGSWWLTVDVRVPAPRRRQLRQGGHPTQTAAEAVLKTVTELLGLADHADEPDAARTQIADMIQAAIRTRQPLPDAQDVRARVSVGAPLDAAPTVAQFLSEWIEAKRDLKANTRRSYRQQIDDYLIPALGRHRLDRLRAAHVQAVLDQIATDAAAIDADNAARHAAVAQAKQAWRDGDRISARKTREALATMSPFRRPAGPATVQRIRACLRSALTDAQKQQLVTVNVAKLVNLPSGRRPKPKVWTTARVEAWRETGEIPCPVMVWTAPQTTALLTRAKGHALYPLYLLITYCGLRRGEAVGLRWTDLDFATGEIQISQQIVQLGWATDTEETKSEAGDRTVIAPRIVIKALAVHRKQQTATRLAHGAGWVKSGLIFTDSHGAALHPDHVLEQFQQLVREADLPPIRLHDLRHGAATLALTAGVPMKTVSEMLGHASIAITADTYTSVVDEARRAAADAIADQLALDDEDDNADSA